MTKREKNASPLVGEAPTKSAERGRAGQSAKAPSAQTHDAPHPPTPAPQGGGGVSYRDAEENDADVLSAFARETWVATFGSLYPPGDLTAYLEAKFGPEIQRAEMAAGGRFRLAFDDAGIVGYCMMGALDMPVDDARGVELHRLYIHERGKGAGIADALMADAIAWARGQGAAALYLSVWENNERAQRFYRRFGFDDYSEWKFMVGQTADRDFIWRLAL